MATKPLPDVAFLRECFILDPDSGILTWRTRPREHFQKDKDWRRWNSRFAGRQTGYKGHSYWRNDRYLVVVINNTSYMAHRIIWKLMHGWEPPDQIDHRNTKGIANPSSNLRLATQSQNSCNRRKQINNKSGFKGVSLRKDSGKWRAKISIDGRKIYLGNFSTPEAAHAAYCEASARLHGEFGRTS